MSVKSAQEKIKKAQETMEKAQRELNQKLSKIVEESGILELGLSDKELKISLNNFVKEQKNKVSE